MGLSGAIGDAGNTGECRRKAWLSWFVRSGAADPGWARRDKRLGTGGVALRDERGSVLVVLLLRDERCSVLVVLLLSPVVTTVAGEVTADVLMTSL
jgi:hypothetical protein